jgi:gas vesicle structural protein
MDQLAAREKEVTLLDLLDRILYKGVIIYGDVTLSVANVDLVYLSLRVLLTSVERYEEMRKSAMDAPYLTSGQVRSDRESPGLGLAAAGGTSLALARPKSKERL